MGKILLIAADWQMRALVRAQLLDEGYEVQAWPSMEQAMESLLRGAMPPQLTILDAEGIDVDAAAILGLWHLTGQVPLLLCLGMQSRHLLSQAGLPPNQTLMRPFRVGDVVQQARKMLA